ncbi:MAG: CHAT domain-containing protein [Caldilineales bacterium]|nr:CHAT domain-containing protein [Caldilineales bacterium]
MQYVDFTIRVQKDGDGFSVRAAAVDASGRKTGEAGPEPLDWAALQQQPAWEKIALIRESPFQVKARDYTEVGGMLFDALFRGQVLRLFTGLYDHAVEPSKDTALRLRLDIDERSPEAAVVPWEFLYWRDKRLHFATNSQILMTRQLLNIDYGAIEALKIDGLPRVLMVIPEGSGLNTDTEREIVKKALQAVGIEPALLEGKVDLGRLDDELADNGPYHILHFIGHGDFEEDDGEGIGYLRFNSPDDSADEVWIEHSRIQNLLQTYRDDLRLVILNACSVGQVSARQSVERTGRGFVGMAPSILKAGVPAVLAMQYEIRDTIAIQFAKTLYERLTKGRWAGKIDAAVTLARNACLLIDPDDRGYATSILYLRAEDGIIFDLQTPPPQPGGKPTATTGDSTPCPAPEKPDDDVLAAYRFDTASGLWGRMQIARNTLLTQNDLIKRLEAQAGPMQFTNPAGWAVLMMQIEQMKTQRDAAQKELEGQTTVLAWLVYGECQKYEANKTELNGLLAKPQRNLTENRRVSEFKRAIAEYEDLAKETKPYFDSPA